MRLDTSIAGERHGGKQGNHHHNSSEKTENACGPTFLHDCLLFLISFPSVLIRDTIGGNVPTAPAVPIEYHTFSLLSTASPAQKNLHKTTYPHLVKILVICYDFFNYADH